eukprot:Pgem_evm1s15436
MGNLTNLDLTDNHISYIPPNLFNDVVMVEDSNMLLDEDTKCSGYGVDISAEGIMTIKTGSNFEYISKCETINITAYSIRGYEIGLLNGFYKLVSLDLSNNKLDSIDNFHQIFKQDDQVDGDDKSYKLRYLYMQNNKITNVPSSNFEDCFQNLETLLLNENDIVTIEDGAFSNSSLSNLTTLNLNGNPIHCCNSSTELLAIKKNITLDFSCYTMDNINLLNSTTELESHCVNTLHPNPTNPNPNLIPIIVSVVIAAVFVLLVVGIALFIYRKKAKKDLLEGKSAIEFVMDKETKKAENKHDQYANIITNDIVDVNRDEKETDYYVPRNYLDTDIKSEYDVPNVALALNVNSDDYYVPSNICEINSNDYYAPTNACKIDSNYDIPNTVITLNGNNNEEEKDYYVPPNALESGFDFLNNICTANTFNIASNIEEVDYLPSKAFETDNESDYDIPNVAHANAKSDEDYSAPYSKSDYDVPSKSLKCK